LRKLDYTDKMRHIIFSTSVYVSECEVVEKLLYFNDDHRKYMDDIEATITSYSEPLIIVDNNRLGIINVTG
jgi:hypothetical protein